MTRSKCAYAVTWPETNRARRTRFSASGKRPYRTTVTWPICAGVYWFHQGDDARALADFETAVTRQPEHELAQTGVARLLEKQDRLTEALAAYVRFASDCPSSDVAVLGIARVLRGLGYLEQARAVAESLDSSLDLPAEFWSEMGSIELESANYQEALRWFDQVPAISGQKKQQLERDAGTSFALLGEPAIADRFFKQADAAEGIEVQISELLPRLVVFPNGGGNCRGTRSAVCQRSAGQRAICSDRAGVFSSRQTRGYTTGGKRPVCFALRCLSWCRR